MKKIISLTLILLLLVTALVGCGGGASNTDAAPEQEATNVEETNKESTEEEAKVEAEAVEEEVIYVDGTYEGEAEGLHTIKVAVEVVGGKIAKVEIVEHEETAGIAEPAIEQIPAAIVEKNSTNVDIVSGATLASDGIINAVKNALEAAK